MMLDFLLGLIGIIILTAYCLIGAFSVPQGKLQSNPNLMAWRDDFPRRQYFRLRRIYHGVEG